MAGVKIEALKGAGAEGAEGGGVPLPTLPSPLGQGSGEAAVPPPRKKIAFFA